MTVDEQTRQRVLARLREVLGEEAAITLMAGVPPFDWSQVATRADVSEVRDEIGELRGEMGELRGEIGVLRGELHSEIGVLRGEMGQMEARLSTAMASQTRYYMVATVGAVLTTGALVFAAAGLT